MESPRLDRSASRRFDHSEQGPMFRHSLRADCTCRHTHALVVGSALSGRGGLGVAGWVSLSRSP
jgi:hypothetical protein